MQRNVTVPPLTPTPSCKSSRRHRRPKTRFFSCEGHAHSTPSSVPAKTHSTKSESIQRCWTADRTISEVLRACIQLFAGVLTQSTDLQHCEYCCANLCICFRTICRREHPIFPFFPVPKAPVQFPLALLNAKKCNEIFWDTSHQQYHRPSHLH